MTTFTKETLTFDGEYLMHQPGAYTDAKFVARFKYSKRDRARFQSFLIKNFTVEEYFAARDAGKAPGEILETKGYISTTVRSLLKRMGYPQTREGRDAYIKAQVAATTLARNAAAK